ncbi:MAG: hypothetical protein ABIO49_06490 [Dokdonella sp.]
MPRLRDTHHEMLLLRTLLLALLASLCISCGSGHDFPEQVDVERSMKSGCRLVSMTGIEAVAEIGADKQVFATHYVADCTTHDGSPSERIAGVITLRKQADWLGLRAAWVAGSNRVAEPEPPAALAKSIDAITSAAADTMYSDGPGCNALVKRIAEEMVPCLQAIKPEMGERLHAAINTFRHNPRLSGGLPNRDAVLMRIDEECESYWRGILYQLDSKSPEGQCVQDPHGA